SISRRCLIRSRNIRLIYCICWELLLILGCTFVRILWWYRFHITVSFSISHSLVHTNSSCTSSTSCFSSSLNNFSSSFTCHGRTCTCHFRTSICSHHRLPTRPKSSINAHSSLDNIWRINQSPCTSNKQNYHANHTNFLFQIIGPLCIYNK